VNECPREENTGGVHETHTLSQLLKLLFSILKVCHKTPTINTLPILKMPDIIFFLQANYIMGHLKGYFEGAKTFDKKMISRIFKISGTLVFLCPFATMGPQVYHSMVFIDVRYMIWAGNVPERDYPSL
jgi:hypothetical protein